MSAKSEVGISPVLLQAITQTLSSKKDGKHSTEIQHQTDEAGNIIVTCEGENKAHILQGMNEPVASLAGAGDTIIVVQNMDVETEQVEHEVETVVEAEPHIIMKQEQVAGETVVESGNMSSVLSAIASHLKNNRKRTFSDIEVAGTSVESSQPNQIVVTMPQGLNTVTVPNVNAQELMVSDMENVITETVVHTISSESPPTNLVKQEYRAELGTQDGVTTTYIVEAASLEDGTPAAFEALQTEQGNTVSIIHESPDVTMEVSGPCPICGDRISGYHYGVYTCESCKGFFKRTVQNKKAFVCHRKGDCVVSVASRKKCPACRFKRCLMTGMKLEAIREDRMRGGRSSYEGCSPAGRVSKPSTPSSAVKANRSYHSQARTLNYTPKARAEQVMMPHSSGASNPTQVLTVYNVDDESRVISGEEPGGEGDVNQIQPHTPQALEDLMTLESLMNEDNVEQPCCEGKLAEGDEDLFGSLLHVTDHCLYRIVRWARNLPDFANISTDDQIILLQNCWAELLCLSVCWHSVKAPPGELQLSHGRTVNLEMAKAMQMGEVMQRLMDLAEQLRDLEVDNHEFVALKALVLMTPDVNGLKERDIIREYQERISEFLLVYSITHYPAKPNKHCELLARLSQLTRTCVLGKELLNHRQAAGEVPQFSLLSELLKGDTIVKTTE